MASEIEQLKEQVRRERERTQRLSGELRKVIAESLVLLWHSRNAGRGGGDESDAGAGSCAARAERAKRNRETVVRNARRARPV